MEIRNNMTYEALRDILNTLANEHWVKSVARSKGRPTYLVELSDPAYFAFQKTISEYVEKIVHNRDAGGRISTSFDGDNIEMLDTLWSTNIRRVHGRNKFSISLVQLEEVECS